jgi:hypothetical protein
MILPRRARDKHRKTKNKRRFLRKGGRRVCEREPAGVAPQRQEGVRAARRRVRPLGGRAVGRRAAACDHQRAACGRPVVAPGE